MKLLKHWLLVSLVLSSSLAMALDTASSTNIKLTGCRPGGGLVNNFQFLQLQAIRETMEALTAWFERERHEHVERVHFIDRLEPQGMIIGQFEQEENGDHQIVRNGSLRFVGGVAFTMKSGRVFKFNAQDEDADAHNPAWTRFEINIRETYLPKYDGSDKAFRCEVRTFFIGPITDDKGEFVGFVSGYPDDLIERPLPLQ